VKKAHPKASILKSGRVVFNIKANDSRLVSVVQYADGVVTALCVDGRLQVIRQSAITIAGIDGVSYS
jgi:hypothetical protein